MEYRIAESRIARATKKVRWLSWVVTGLVMSHLVLGGLLTYQWSHHSVVLVPIGLQQSARIGGGQVSAAYLEAVAIMLINDRLNVTPETISGNDAHLLRSVDPAYYAAFKQQLLLDEETVQQSKVSSTFYLTDVKTQPDKLTIDVSGKLKRWVGERLIGEVIKHYKLKFSTKGYAVALTSFQEIAEEVD